MKIVIDLQACQSGSRLGGIGRYSLALAKAMVGCATHDGHEVYVMLNALFPRDEFGLRMEFADLLDPDHFLSFQVAGAVAANDARQHPYKEIAELTREEMLRQLEPDIVHVASLIEGWGDDVVTSVHADGLADRTAVTWYDLIPYVQPEMYLADPGIAAHYHSKVDEARNAALLLAISQYSCDEALELLNRPADSVINISSAVDSQFRPTQIPEAVSSQLKHRLGIDRPFLMYTGSFDARKNQARLIEAFARLPASVRDQYQLIIAGNGWDGVYAKLTEVGRQAGLSPSSLVFTGRVSDEDLFRLYNLCHLFVFPSLREGFGLPALEAMACGTPAIGSNCTSVPEVIGRSDALFDPQSVDSISQKIHDVLTNDGWREELIRHGLEHSQRFSWEASARRALEGFEAVHQRQTSRVAGRIAGAGSAREGVDQAYQRLIDSIATVVTQTKLPDAQLLDFANAIERNETAARRVNQPVASEPGVGWVTPWNTRCGIASYSEYLVRAGNVGQTVIFAEQSCQPDTGGQQQPQVIPCWSAGEQDDLKELARQVDAHDVDALIIQVNYGFFNFAALNQFVAQQVGRGRSVVMTLHSTQDPPARILRKRLVDLRPALSGCQRVLVHTEQDAERLAKSGVSRNVSVFPHGVPEVHIPAPQSCSSDVFTLATYGFFLPHKGLLETIEAFARLAENDPQLKLRMVNAEYSPESSGPLIQAARQAIQERGIEDRVELICDYLPDEESLALLSSANLIVFPYQNTGESSSAAVRMGLASQRPVAVTPLDIFRDVSDAVLMLPGTGVDELEAGIGELVQRLRHADDTELQSVGERASAWRQRHALGTIAGQLATLTHRQWTCAESGAPSGDGNSASEGPVAESEAA